MAVDFGGIIFLRIGNVGAPLITTPPLTFAARVRPGPNAGVICAIARAFAQGFEDTAGWALETFGATQHVRAQQLNGPVAVTANGSLNLNAWNAVTSVFPTVSRRTAWCNGVAGVEDVSGGGVQTVGENLIGVRDPVLGPFRPYDGCMGEVGMYATDWDARDQAKFAAGISLLHIKQAALVAYLPMVDAATVTTNLRGVAATINAQYLGGFSDCADNPVIINPPVKSYSKVIG